VSQTIGSPDFPVLFNRRALVAEQNPGLKDGWVFPNGAGHPMQNGSLSKHADINKRMTIHGLRRERD